MELMKAMELRRTRYALSNASPISDERIEEILKEVMPLVPSAFNAQTQRMVLLLGEKHTKLWTIVMETLRAQIAPENFQPTEDKINGLRAAYGSILYYEETETVKGLQKQYPFYAENFPIWSQQENGMLQYAVWTALSAEGLGVSLQHYNPIIDEEVRATFSIPESWNLIAQMPFGTATAEEEPKDRLPIDEKVLVRK